MLIRMTERALPTPATMEATRDSRLSIGFSKRAAWRNAQAHFDEHSLTIQGHPVMQDWEEEYMAMLAAIATSQGGIVLEVGFGMGISARHIQRHSVDWHIIIEANRDVHARLETFELTAPRPVQALLGFWEEITPTFPAESVDGILFDTYPLSPNEIHENHFSFFREAYRLLKPGGIFTYYSDEQDSFSPRHKALLVHAGFTSIQKRICKVRPPRNCAYWQRDSLLVPIIRK